MRNGGECKSSILDDKPIIKDSLVKNCLFLDKRVK